MAASNPDHGSESVSPPTPSSPDELIKDLELTEEEQSSVVGGRKAGGDQQEYLIVKLTDIIVT
jgi:type VI protein secretion system component Hcp